MYVDAMDTAKANTKPINAFLTRLEKGTDVYRAMITPEIPMSI